MSLSEIRVNTTKTRTGVGTITYTETGPVITGIATASNFKTGSTNVHSTGVELANINTGGSTATFGGAISGTTASFSGNVSIGGTLTYEDVTNIDSVGIITATKGIDITAGTSNLYQTDGSLSYYAANNGVYLNGAGANGWLRLQAAGSANDRTSINLSGHSRTNGDEIYFKTNSTEKLRITSGGQISIDSRSNAGTTFGNARLSILPESRTSAFAPEDGDTWHDVVLHQGGSATNNAVGIAFQLKNDGSYHKNAGTGIAAVKNGTNSDYGADLVFITRGQSTAATEKLRITSGGDVAIGRNSVLASARLTLQCVAGDPAISVQTNTSGGTVDLIKAYSSAGSNVASICVNPDATPDLLFKVYDGSNTIEKLRITSGGNIETQGLGTFEFNNGWSAEGRNINVFPCDDVSNWFSFIGTNLRFTDGGNFVKPSDNSNSNWGNIAGIAFEGVNQNSSSGNHPAIRFVVDQPGENGANLSLGSGNTGKTAAIDNKTAAFVSGNGHFIANNNIGINESSPQTALHIGSGGKFRFERSDGTRYGELWNDNSFVELKASTDPIRLNAQSYIRFDIASNERSRIDQYAELTLDSGSQGNNSKPGIELKSTGYTGNITRLFQDSPNAISVIETTERSLVLDIDSGNQVNGTNLSVHIDGTEEFRFDPSSITYKDITNSAKGTLIGPLNYHVDTNAYVNFSQWYLGTDWNHLEVFGYINPNSAGSGAYTDPVHMYIYRGIGWDQANNATAHWIYSVHVAPPARQVFPSGSGMSGNSGISAVWYHPSRGIVGNKSSNGADYLRLVIPNVNQSYNFQKNFRILRRY